MHSMRQKFLFASHTVKFHHLHDKQLKDIFRATCLTKLTYAQLGWDLLSPKIAGI